MVIVWNVTDFAFLKKLFRENTRNCSFCIQSFYNFIIIEYSWNCSLIFQYFQRKKNTHESGRHIFFNQSTSINRYSEVIFSGNRRRWSFHVWAKNISAAYVILFSSIESSPFPKLKKNLFISRELYYFHLSWHKPITVTWKYTTVGRPSLLGGRILSYVFGSAGRISEKVNDVLNKIVS